MANRICQVAKNGAGVKIINSGLQSEFCKRLLNEAELIDCLIRKVPVAATPEEKVRQQLLVRMVKELGYPFGNIAVERELSQMPHLSKDKGILPKRRTDIVCFASEIHPEYPFYPLIVIECKAVPLSVKVIDQVVGYNHFLRSFFIAAVNQSEIVTGWYSFSEKRYCFTSDLPPYESIKSAVTTKGLRL